MILASGGSGLVFAFAGAVLIGVSLGLLGSGGAIVTIPILTYLVGHDEKAAIAESFVIVGGIALVGGLKAARSRGVEWWVVVFFGGAGAFGSYVGSAVAKHLPGSVQLVMLGVLMLTAACLMARKGKPAARSSEGAGASRASDAPGPVGAHAADSERTDPGASGRSAEVRRRALSLIFQGGAVGTITGLTGIGGGFVIVPALVLISGLPMKRAIGTSLCIIVVNCTVGFLHRLVRETGVSIDWGTIVVFSALGIVGALAGGHVRDRVNQALLRKVFAVFLVLLAAFIMYREVPGLLRGDAPASATPGKSGQVEGAR